MSLITHVTLWICALLNGYFAYKNYLTGKKFNQLRMNFDLLNEELEVLLVRARLASEEADKNLRLSKRDIN